MVEENKRMKLKEFNQLVGMHVDIKEMGSDTLRFVYEKGFFF